MQMRDWPMPPPMVKGSCSSITAFWKGSCARSGQPATLREWGVRREDLPHLAGLGLTKGRADNNPAELTAEKVQRILEEIYEERPVTLSA